MSDEKVKVYTMKIGRFFFSVRGKKVVDAQNPKRSKEQLLAADAYQAAHFGYNKLGARSIFMTRRAVEKYLEKKFSEQDERAKNKFVRAMQRQKKHHAGIAEVVASAKAK